MTLSHDELRSLLAASALNALPSDEAEQLERHLKRCSDCRTELVEFETDHLSARRTRERAPARALGRDRCHHRALRARDHAHSHSAGS